MHMLSELYAEWIHCKNKEDEWKAKRLDVEERLKPYFTLKEEGQQTLAEGGFKGVAKNSLYYRVADKELFHMLLAEGVLPQPEFADIVLKDKGLKSLRRSALTGDEFSKNLFERVLPAFSITPAKTNFEIVKVR
jgi:hypothetical protein